MCEIASPAKTTATTLCVFRQSANGLAKAGRGSSILRLKVIMDMLSTPMASFRSEQEEAMHIGLAKCYREVSEFICSVKSAVVYDAKSGQFHWKERSDRSDEWNRKYCGSIAGTVNSHGYITFRINGKTQKAHRLAWLIAYGRWPLIVDHINGNRQDNRLCNLREVCQQKNRMNSAKRSDNSSGVTGVKKTSAKNPKWRADIKIGGKEIYLGTFVEKDDAIKARRMAEQVVFGDYRRNQVGFGDSIDITACNFS